MDCTFPSSSATQCLQQLDEEQLDQWKYSRCIRPQYHHSEHSLSQTGQGWQNSRLEPLECRDLLVQNALFTGNLEMVQKYFTKSAAINLIIETKGDELRWTSRKFGRGDKSQEPICTRKVDGPAQAYWQALLTGDQGVMSEILSDPENNLSPNAVFDTSDLEEWKNYRFNLRRLTSTDCVHLLLSFGADPEAVSEDGYKPLHLCKSPDSIECVQQLLQHGAGVNSRTEEENDTALHIAARHGLPDHVQLLLCYGAELEAKNEEGQTPLNAACAQPHQPQDMDRYYRVCQLLVESGASINAADKDRQHPLHLACKNANAQVAELLLARGANVNVMNYSGNTALHNILQATAYKLEHHPELVVRALLNYGAIRIWPGALLKVLRYCHTCPRVIEALMNSYDHVRVSEDWVEAVPAEVVQKYQCFYQSLFSLEQRPRSLQHLARCTLRTFLEGRLLLVLSQLHLPSALHRFLLLSFEDVLY
ncbi:PREDICTED: ankyrin repeat and SOCS box protein 10-like [Leptosomus discolor]|uniref:ankyrin repeat and SOCS box protein 10-like n=1 Tax=Leptosomus discolor TaxID=188344 RepID=UPI000522454F|nr:PREDICTED: ankyrin repeat and SOCS box protein 10-like [Leptosomus discolor]